MGDVELKRFSCAFDDKVFCSFRRTKKFTFMHRCETCQHYRDFVREMEDEENEFFEEVERLRRGDFNE